MIGIITLYYRNYNIGGLLQAYAMQKVLTQLDVESEQLCVYHYKQEEISRKQKIYSKLLRLIKNPYQELSATIDHRIIDLKRKRIQKELAGRREFMDSFMEKIPHSKEVYDSDNIRESLKVYDGFIVGSDQVWNDDYISEKYMEINTLSFVPDTYLKIAYGASIGKNENFKDWFDRCMENLKSFDAVSVREKSAQSILNRSGIASPIVLDPTLLLEKKYWDALVHTEKINGGSPYIFTYFLGKDKRSRDFAKKLSRLTGYPILNFAHAINFYRDEDKEFGDYKIIEYSPEDFVNDIVHAEMIVTDSFHACVFSMIFHKPFYAVARASDHGISSMNSRLEDLLDSYGLKNRYVHADEMDDVDADHVIGEIDYNRVDGIIAQQRKASINFLLDQIHHSKKAVES